MADTKDDPKEKKGEETVAAPNTEIASIEAALDETADKIAETPDEDKDTEWRKELSLALKELGEQIADLKASQGASAEVTALAQEVRELKQALEAQAQSRPPSSDVEAVPPIPETHKETSSDLTKETPPKPEPKPAKVVKPPRAKSWL